jgi:hypothetical protein
LLPLDGTDGFQKLFDLDPQQAAFLGERARRGEHWAEATPVSPVPRLTSPWAEGRFRSLDQNIFHLEGPVDLRVEIEASRETMTRDAFRHAGESEGVMVNEISWFTARARDRLVTAGTLHRRNDRKST